MRLVFLGDSLTWGEYGGSFVRQVAAQMAEHDISNAGEAGDTVVNLLRRLESVIAEHIPDAMFVMVGGNDAISYTVPAVRPYYQTVKKLDNGRVTPETYASAYRELLTQLQLHYIHPLIGLAPAEYNRELVAARQRYNTLAREVADSLNIPVLDLATPFTPAAPIDREPVTMTFIRQIGERVRSGWHDYETERARWGYTYTFDGMHLTPEAAKEFAALIVPFLREHL